MYSTAVSARIYKKNVEINFSKTVFIEKKASQTVNSTKTLKPITQETLNIIVSSLNLELSSLIEQEVRLVRISLLYSMLQYEVPIVDIAQKVLYDDSLKWCLLVIVKGSGNIFKEWPYSDKAASTAITILNSGRVSFSGMDLSHIRIPNADLSQGMFDDTDFTSADLSRVNLQGSWLRKINLESTIMQEVTFGEKPSIYATPKQAKITCYSKNGEWLAIASNSHIFLYNAHTNIREKETASRLTIESIVFSPNSQYLVFGGERSSIYECSLRIWNIKEDSIQCFVHRELHNKIVKDITFSDDGKYMLASQEDSDIVIFSIKDKKLSLYKILENQGTSKTMVKFFDNDKIIGFGIKDEDKVKSIKFWNMETGALIKSTNIYDPVEVCKVNFSDNNKYMIFGNHDGTITLWEVTLENINVIAILSGHVGSVSSVIFLDDKKIISGGEDHSIKIWNTQTKELIKTFEGHTGSIISITLSPNNKELVSAGSSDHTVRFWSLNNLGIYNVHPSSIECIAISSNGKVLASSNSDNKIKLYDVNTGVCLKTLDGHKKGHIKIIQFTLDIKYIAAINDNTLKIWNLEDNMFCQEIEASQDTESSKSKKIENMMLLPKKEFIVAISGEFGKSAIVERWHFKDLNLKKMTTICLEMNSNCIIIPNSAFSSDGTRFISGGSYYYGSYHLVLWDTMTGKLLAETEDSLRPNCVIFYSDSYDRKLVLCQNHGFNLEIFDEHLRSISIINNDNLGFSEIDSIAISPDNKLLVVSFTEGNSKSNYKHQMQIWSNCNVYTMHFSNRINSICWNKVYESLFLVTGSYDALRYWQVKLQEDKVIYLRLSWSSYQRLLKLDGIRYNNATVLSLENSELLKQQNVSLDNNREMLTKEWLPQFMVKASQSKEDVSPIGDAFSTLSLRLKKHCKC